MKNATEADRLATIARDMGERLADYERRAERAADLSIPGPTPADVEAARRRYKAAQAAADGAARWARSNARRAGR